MGQLIIPIGITALTSLILTFLFGIHFFQKYFGLKASLNFKMHKIFAWLTLILAIIHGSLVFIVYF